MKKVCAPCKVKAKGLDYRPVSGTAAAGRGRPPYLLQPFFNLLIAMTTPVKILVAGLVATGAMTLLMMVAPMMGMPPMNIGAMLGGMLGASATVGWMMHFMIGVVFTAAYAFFFNQRLPISSPVARGAAYGVLVFVMAQVMFALMRTMGLMPPAGESMLLGMMGSLLGHLVFGAVLGGFFSAQRAPVTHILA